METLNPERSRCRKVYKVLLSEKFKHTELWLKSKVAALNIYKNVWVLVYGLKYLLSKKQ